MHRRIVFLAGVTLMSSASRLDAQNSEPDPGNSQVERVATTGRFHDAEAGLTLKLPGGFGFLTRQGTLTIFGSKTAPGVILLESGERFTEAELESTARNGYQDEGVALQPAGQARRLALADALGMSVPVTGTLDGQSIRGLLTGVHSRRDGRCFIVLAATTPESWPRLAPVAEQVAAGIVLVAPQPTGHDHQWTAYFGGTKLSYYFSRSSSSLTGTSQGSLQSTERIYLCSDGSFQYGEQTTAAFDLPQAMGYSRTGDHSAGRWTASGSSGGAQLTLTFHDGRLWRYQATRMGKEVLFLNGSKYFRSGQERCK